MKSIYFSILSACFLLTGALFPVRSYSQDDTETQEKAKAKVRVAYFKNENDVKSIKATVTARIEKKWEPVENLAISVYRDSISAASLIRQVKTDNKGVGIVELQSPFNRPDSSGQMKFVAAIDPNDNYRESEEEIEVKDLALLVKAEVVDSIGKVMVSASEMGTEGIENPAAGLDVNFYVKRMFSLLKIGSESTDDAGNVELEIPKDIPGDANGMIEVIVKVEDHDDFGTVAATCGKVQCGIFLSEAGESRTKVRALWSPNAPLWMVITFDVLMVGVWGHFLYIIYALSRIRKSGASNSNKEIIWTE